MYNRYIVTVLLFLLYGTASAVSFSPISNNVSSLAVRGNEIWSGTGNGITVWNRLNGSHVTYHSEDGLKDGYIRSLFVDSRNSVWAGSASGISEYNGDHWIIHNPGFDISDVFSIAEDKDHVLWFATCNGIVFYDRSKWSVVQGYFGGPEHCTFSVAVDCENVKWFGTASKGVLQYDGASWKQYTSRDGLVTDIVYSIAVDKNNVKWFGCFDTTEGESYHTGGMSRYDGISWTSYLASDWFSCGTVISLAVDDKNTVWIGTYGGAFKFNRSTMTRCYPEDGIIFSKVTQAIAVIEDEQWFGTQTGLYRFTGLEWTAYINRDGMNIDNVSHIAVDQDNIKWFCSRYGGISSFDGKRWVDHSGEPGLKDCKVWSVCVGPDNVKWFGTVEGGLTRFDDHSWITFHTGNSDILSDDVHSVAVDRDNIVWVWTRKGVQSFNGVSWKYYPMKYLPQEFAELEIGKDNVKWFSIDGGLARFDGEKWEYILRGDRGFPGDHVVSLHIDRDNVLWAGFTLNPPINPGWKEGDDPKDKYNYAAYDLKLNGLCRLDGVSFKTFLWPDNLPDYCVNAIVSDAGNTIWIGTSRGIARLDGTKWKSYSGELSHMGIGCNIYAAAVDINNVLWFSTPNEIFVFENGAIKSTNGAITSVKEETTSPQSSFLLVNYPNPFNPYTSLSFSLPTAVWTNMTVYSVAGQKVKELVSEILSAGPHSILWNGMDEHGITVSSGVYLAVLKAGKNVVSRKVVMLR